MSSAYGQHRTPGSRLRRRRRSLLVAGGSVTAALTAALSFASFTGADIASAAVERAKSFLQLMSQRSPGERVKGELTKTKRKHYRVLAERESPPLPSPPLSGSLVDVLAPPAALLPASLAATPLIVEEAPPPGLPPGIIIIPPPPGGIVIPCCGAGPPPPGPPPPPALRLRRPDRHLHHRRHHLRLRRLHRCRSQARG